MRNLQRVQAQSKQGSREAHSTTEFNRVQYIRRVTPALLSYRLVISAQASELGPALGRPKRGWLQWQLHPRKPASMDRGEHDEDNAML